jgi:hypothetical protein
MWSVLSEMKRAGEQKEVPQHRHFVVQTESLTSSRETDHCSLDCNLQNLYSYMTAIPYII